MERFPKDLKRTNRIWTLWLLRLSSSKEVHGCSKLLIAKRAVFPVDEGQQRYRWSNGEVVADLSRVSWMTSLVIFGHFRFLAIYRRLSLARLRYGTMILDSYS